MSSKTVHNYLWKQIVMEPKPKSYSLALECKESSTYHWCFLLVLFSHQTTYALQQNGRKVAYDWL